LFTRFRLHVELRTRREDETVHLLAFLQRWLGILVKRTPLIVQDYNYRAFLSEMSRYEGWMRVTDRRIFRFTADSERTSCTSLLARLVISVQVRSLQNVQIPGIGSDPRVQWI
jgi:hypothetical protein